MIDEEKDIDVNIKVGLRSEYATNVSNLNLNLSICQYFEVQNAKLRNRGI